ncbi:MAG: WD40 repeat protein [Pirellulaceae bacterium]|jgi:WD40 repeat protein
MKNVTANLITLLVLGVAFVPAIHAQSISFRTDVAPILVKRCLTCHGEQKAKGEYHLFSFATLMKAGESSDASVVPGKPQDSYLYQLIAEEDADARMPKDADALTKEEIELIKNWIAAGAKFDGDDSNAELVATVIWTHSDPPAVYQRPFPVTAVSFRPDGKELAVGGYHEITIWNAADGTLVRRIKNIAERTYALTYSKDGLQLAAASGTPAQLGEVKVFNPADGELIRHFASMADCAFDVAFSGDGKRLAACGADHKVRVYDVASGKQELAIKDHSDWVMGVAWSPDDTKLATASRDKTSKVFDAKTGQLMVTYPDHGKTVYDIAFNADGSRAISCGGDNRIRVWHPTDQGYEDKDMKKKKQQHIHDVSGFSGEIFHLTFHEGHVFACSSDASDASVRQHDADKRNQINEFKGHTEWVFALDYNPATKRLATGSLDGQVRIWDTQEKDRAKMNVATFVAAPGYKPATEAVQLGGE